jgi:hypothetical protein
VISHTISIFSEEYHTHFSLPKRRSNEEFMKNKKISWNVDGVYGLVISFIDLDDSISRIHHSGELAGASRD